MAEDTPTLDINLNDLTLGELEAVETLSGERIGRAFNGDFSATTVLALVTVFKQRENAEFTIDDARALPFSVMKSIKVSDKPDPS